MMHARAVQACKGNSSWRHLSSSDDDEDSGGDDANEPFATVKKKENKKQITFEEQVGHHNDGDNFWTIIHARKRSCHRIFSHYMDRKKLISPSMHPPSGADQSRYTCMPASRSPGNVKTLVQSTCTKEQQEDEKEKKERKRRKKKEERKKKEKGRKNNNIIIKSRESEATRSKVCLPCQSRSW
jgi:hypothetical protein